MQFTLVIPLSIVLLADPPAATPHLTQAVQSVEQQAEWFGSARKGFSTEFVTALATMNYVQSRLSPLNYSILTQQNKPLPQNPEECLAKRAGICGSQVETFTAIANRLGLRVRPVQFFLHGPVPEKNHSHIAVEVFYGDRWRFFDVTWGTYFRRSPEGPADDLLSWEEIRKSKDARSLAVTNESDLWYQQWKGAGLDPLEYVDAKEMDVLLGRRGTIRLRPIGNSDGKSITYRPIHQPNFVGRNSAEKDVGATDFRLLGVKPSVKRLSIKVLGVAGGGVLRVEGTSGVVTRDLSEIQSGRLMLDISGLMIEDNLLLRIVPDKSSVGYVVFEEIVIEQETQP